METQQKADMILSSNAVFTGIMDTPQPGAVAIVGNKIAAIGSEADMESLIGPDTKQYRYHNELIMPGFHDFHLHLMLGSLAQDSVHLHEARSEEEAAEMVRKFADTRPNDSWIIGFGWYHVYWENGQLPHRSTLDRVISERPVFLFNAECHGAWVNSKALEMANITRDTPNPPFGEIGKDDDGEPTGFLYETAMGLAREAFVLPHERRQRLLRSFLQQAARLGITSVNDMFPLPGLDFGDLPLYKEFEEREELTSRIHFLAPLNGDLDYAKELRSTYTSGTLQFSGLKQFLDGVPTTYTAYLLAPYSDKPDTYGDTLLPPHMIKQWTNEADREGFRIRFHACGDGAVRLGLDAFEEARRANGVRDSRHTIEHIEVIHPEDIPRLYELGVIASMQPEHLAASENFSDNAYLSRLGKEREAFTFPIKTLEEAGTKIAFSSDFPVVPLNPLLEIYRAITRVHNDGLPKGGWNGKERISLAQALRYYTWGPAYGTFRELELGTLEPGKLADIVVLSQNLFEVSPEEVRDASVRMTIMDGKIVFQE